MNVLFTGVNVNELEYIGSCGFCGCRIQCNGREGEVSRGLPKGQDWRGKLVCRVSCPNCKSHSRNNEICAEETKGY